jgi:hypothetical protein
MSVSINGTNGVTFNDGSLQKTSAQTGFRNRIINGDMRIDQRNAGAVHTPIANTYSVDRWNFQLSQASKVTAQRQPVTNPQQADNNTFCLVATVSSAYTVTASDYFLIGHFIEGFNCADLGWGTSGAKAVTLSFWTYSTIAGTFGGVFANSATSRSYPFTYQISSVNTWEKKTITLAGDTSGTWLTDNGIGIRLYFGLGVGSTYSAPAGSWTTGFLGATGATSIMGTAGAGFVITGVQLEAGSTATDFERRPIGTELALCQRYYDKSYSMNVAPGTNTLNGMVQGIMETYAGAWYQGGGSIRFTTEMRRAPDFNYRDHQGTLNRFTSFWTGSYGFNINPTVTLFVGTKAVSILETAGPSGGWSGSPLMCHYTADAEL